ncbi:MAG: hypothetical protein ABFD66_13230 [Smithella sp.]
MGAQAMKCTKPGDAMEWLGSLSEKGGGMSLQDFVMLPMDTQRKLARIFRAVRMLPNKFFSSKVRTVIEKDLGMSDYQRLLHMLWQGDYFMRESGHGHRLCYSKTERARTLTDEQLAADIVSKNEIMFGYLGSGRKSRRKRSTTTDLKVLAGQAQNDANLLDMNALLQALTAPDNKQKYRLILERLTKLGDPDLRLIDSMLQALIAMRVKLPFSHRDFLIAFANNPIFRDNDGNIGTGIR